MVVEGEWCGARGGMVWWERGNGVVEGGMVWWKGNQLLPFYIFFMGRAVGSGGPRGRMAR